MAAHEEMRLGLKREQKSNACGIKIIQEDISLSEKI